MLCHFCAVMVLHLVHLLLPVPDSVRFRACSDVPPTLYSSERLVSCCYWQHIRLLTSASLLFSSLVVMFRLVRPAMRRVFSATVASSSTVTFHSAPTRKCIGALIGLAASAGVIYSSVEMEQSIEAGEGKPEGVGEGGTGSVLDRFVALRPKDQGFVRIDETVLREKSEFVVGHALHEALKGDSLVETFEIYLNPKTSELHTVAHFGVGLNGHPSVVHGGILALAFDESFGWLLHFGLKTPQAFTANLNVNYR